MGLPRKCGSVCRDAMPAADPMRGYLEICGSVCGAAMPAADPLRGCLEICGSVRGAAFVLKIGCGSNAGLPRNLRICTGPISHGFGDGWLTIPMAG